MSAFTENGRPRRRHPQAYPPATSPTAYLPASGVHALSHSSCHDTCMQCSCMNMLMLHQHIDVLHSIRVRGVLRRHSNNCTRQHARVFVEGSFRLDRSILAASCVAGDIASMHSFRVHAWRAALYSEFKLYGGMPTACTQTPCMHVYTDVVDGPACPPACTRSKHVCTCMYACTSIHIDRYNF